MVALAAGVNDDDSRHCNQGCDRTAPTEGLFQDQRADQGREQDAGFTQDMLNVMSVRSARRCSTQRC